MLPKETPTNHPHAIYFVFGKHLLTPYISPTNSSPQAAPAPEKEPYASDPHKNSASHTSVRETSCALPWNKKPSTPKSGRKCSRR